MRKVFAIQNPDEIEESIKAETNKLQDLYNLFIQNENKPIWECIDNFWNFFQISAPKPIFPVTNYGYDDPLLINYIGSVMKQLTKEIQQLYEQNPQLHYYGKKIDFDFCHLRQYPHVLIDLKNKNLRKAFQKCLPYDIQ